MTGGQYDRNISNTNKESLGWQSKKMVEYITKYNKNGKKSITVKFHNTVKSFKRVELFKYQGKFYNIYIDKNDSVHNLERTEVASWKEIIKGRKKIRVPDEVTSTPEVALLNKIKGNPYKIAVEKIKTEIEREFL